MERHPLGRVLMTEPLRTLLPLRRLPMELRHMKKHPRARLLLRNLPMRRGHMKNRTRLLPRNLPMKHRPTKKHPRARLLPRRRPMERQHMKKLPLLMRLLPKNGPRPIHLPLKRPTPPTCLVTRNCPRHTMSRARHPGARPHLAVFLLQTCLPPAGGFLGNVELSRMTASFTPVLVRDA